MQFINSPQKLDFVTNKHYSKIFEPSIGEILIPDYLLVPLLAFDKNLQRLGMGKGFYDNTIEALKRKNPNLKSFGIAFNFQQSLQALPTLKTDSRLDYVITETNFFIAK